VRLISQHSISRTTKNLPAIGRLRFAVEHLLRHIGLGTFASVFVLSSHLTTAAPGDLDPSFGIGGQVTSDFRKSNDIAYAVALQPDGKIVIAGIRFVGISATGGDFLVARYNPDGTLDRSFGQRGFVLTDFGLTETATAVVVQPDGRIVVAGGTYPIFPSQGGQYALARYNRNGSLDTTFGAGGLVRTTFLSAGCFASALVLQADGKIIAAGTKYLDFASDSDFALARYNPDGSLDSTFGAGGEVATDFHQGIDNAFSVLLQSDGRIVAVGDSNSVATFYDFALVRYLANGSIDTTFGNLGKVETDFGAANLDQARSAILQPDGKIVAAGTTVARNGLDQLFAIARYNSDGSRDNTFGKKGLAKVDFGSFDQGARSILLQPDGKLITVGFADTESSDSDFLTARLNAAGTLDTTFGVGGEVRTSFGDLNGGANAAALQSDGNIVAVGFNATPTKQGVDVALARYLGN
jgi:uncharacterized delta-60 repeat protein